LGDDALRYITPSSLRLKDATDPIVCSYMSDQHGTSANSPEGLTL
jgi:hypothetical protein